MSARDELVGAAVAAAFKVSRFGLMLKVAGVGVALFLVLILFIAPIVMVGPTQSQAATCSPSDTDSPPGAPAMPGAPACPAPGGTGAVSGDAKTLAAALVQANAEGRLTYLEARHFDQIRWVAEGRAVEGCNVDVRVLQLLTIALQNFDSVGISDVNRNCTGQLLGAGTASSHNVRGGGEAVDISSLNGAPVDGDDADSRRLIQLLDAMVPSGTRVGQIQCREGRALILSNFTQFWDSCNHIHLDFAYTFGAPMNI